MIIKNYLRSLLKNPTRPLRTSVQRPQTSIVFPFLVYDPGLLEIFSNTNHCNWAKL